MTEFRSFGARFWVFLAGEAFSAIGSWASLVAIWGYAAYAFDAEPARHRHRRRGLAAPAGRASARSRARSSTALGPRKVLVAAKVLGAAGVDRAGLRAQLPHLDRVLVRSRHLDGVRPTGARRVPPRIVSRQTTGSSQLLAQHRRSPRAGARTGRRGRLDRADRLQGRVHLRRHHLRRRHRVDVRRRHARRARCRPDGGVARDARRASHRRSDRGPVRNDPLADRPASTASTAPR